MKIKVFTGSQEHIRDTMAKDYAQMCAKKQGVKVEDYSTSLKEDPSLLRELDGVITLFDEGKVITYYGTAEPLFKSLADLDEEGATLLIISTPTFPKSKAKGAAGKADITALPAMKNPADIAKFYLNSVPGLPSNAVARLSSHVGRDLHLLPLIISTLQTQYGEDLENITVEEVMQASGAGAMPAPWDLTGAIDQGNLPLALRVSQRLQEGRGSPHGVMAILMNHVTMLYRVSRAHITDEKEGAEMLGVKGSTYPIRKAITTSNRYGIRKLETMVNLTDAAQTNIRGGSSLDPKVVVEILISRLASM